MNHHHQFGYIGWWFAGKYQERARIAGVQAAARQLRKQGVPIEVALDILAPPRCAQSVPAYP